MPDLGELLKYVFCSFGEVVLFYFSSAIKFQFLPFLKLGNRGCRNRAGCGDGGTGKESGRQKFYSAVMRFPGKIIKLQSYLR